MPEVYTPKCLDETEVNLGVKTTQIQRENGRERFEAQKDYWDSLSEDQQYMIQQYKETAYQIFTPASGKYLQLDPVERMKLLIDRTYETIQENKNTKIYQSATENSRPTKNKINLLLTKPDILFSLNNIVLEAPIISSGTISLYRGIGKIVSSGTISLYRAIAKQKYSQRIIDMKVGDIFLAENVMSTTGTLDKAKEFTSSFWVGPKDVHAPLIIEFKLDATYPRYDLIYLEGCVKKNQEDEYLLPALLKQNFPSENTVYRNLTNDYVQAKWKCIRKTRLLIDFGRGDPGYLVDYVIMEPSYETNDKPITQRQLKKQAELNSIFMMPSRYRNTPMTQRELQEEAQRNSNSAMATYMKNKDGGKRSKGRKTRKAKK